MLHNYDRDYKDNNANNDKDFVAIVVKSQTL